MDFTPDRLDTLGQHSVPPDLIYEIFLHSAASRSQALTLTLVCKEAYAWITRLLYRSVTFSHCDDLFTFQRTITLHPELAEYICSLYIGPTVNAPISGLGEISWSADCLASIRYLLSQSRNIESLALVNLPPSNWHAIEQLLPPRLKTLAVGPSYGLLGINVAHPELRSFYYVDTVLQTAELSRIAKLPSLSDFRWRSPLQFDEIVYAQLKLLLSSLSLKTLHITLYGAEADVLRFYKDEYEELIADTRLTIVCDPHYEGNREWISNFHRQWMDKEE